LQFVTGLGVAILLEKCDGGGTSPVAPAQLIEKAIVAFRLANAVNDAPARRGATSRS
jgi:hypothetical protein